MTAIGQHSTIMKLCYSFYIQRKARDNGLSIFIVAQDCLYCGTYESVQVNPMSRSLTAAHVIFGFDTYVGTGSALSRQQPGHRNEKP
jgi:hypothetical protein